MVDVFINRCKLRVVRRGGWAWGAEPQRLLNTAVQVLPELIARKLEGLWPDESDNEITAPVRINLPIYIGEFLAACADIPQDDSSLGDRLTRTLDAKLTQALKSTFQPDNSVLIETTSAYGDSFRAEKQDRSSETKQIGSTLLRLLLKWRDQGLLVNHLESFSLTSLEAWHQCLLEAGVYISSESAVVSTEEIGRLTSEIVREFPRTPLNRAAVLRRRMIVALEVVGKLGMMSVAVMQKELHRLLPLENEVLVKPPTKAHDRSQHSEPLEDQSPIAPELESQASVKRLDYQPSPQPLLRAAELHICSALPFLMLGPLSRIGYLKAISANLEAAKLLQQLPQFATALAYKVLDPPERGWRRHPAAVIAAAAFAGLAEPVAEPDLVEFARKISDHLSPLDAVLSESLIEGHNPHQPLLLQRTESLNGSGLLLVDVEGLFPIALASELDGLFAILSKCKSSFLLIPEAIADPRLLGQLDASDFRFITDAPPVRHERWRPLRCQQERWWTNDQTSAESSLLKSAQRLADAQDDAHSLWQSLSVDRPSVPLDRYGAFDHHLTLAAATALGTIAWMLWREREPVVPQLSLERFSDLDACVRYSHESVRVRIPLGRRFYDLQEHRLLEEVRDVPWLDGRVLQFSGG